MLRTLLVLIILAGAVGAAWMYDHRSDAAPVLPQPVRGYTPKSHEKRQVARPRPVRKHASRRMPDGRPAPRSMQDLVAHITVQTEKVRGLSLSKPVVVRFISRSDYARRYRMESDRDWPVRDRRALEKSYVALGLMSARYDLNRLAKADDGSDILGVYEPQVEKLFVIGNPKKLTVGNRITMSHELTHALQDQNYGLSRLFASAGGNDDKVMALKSLVEGDATFTMFRFQGLEHYTDAQAREASDNENPVVQGYADAPPVFGLRVYFPYYEGTAWVAQLYGRGGWKAVNEAYRNPPQSSEQIMHVEKYLSHEQPVNVRTPDLRSAIGKGWTKLTTNTLGEYTTLILLLTGDVPSIEASTAAAGWGGDTYTVYSQRGGGGTVLVWDTAWDTRADAAQFERALVMQQDTLNEDVFGQKLARHGRWLSVDGAEANVRVYRQGDRVVLVVVRGGSAKLADRVVARMAR